MNKKMNLLSKLLIAATASSISISAMAARYNVVEVADRSYTYSTAVSINENGDVVGNLGGKKYVPENPCDGVNHFAPTCILSANFLDEDGDGIDDDDYFYALTFAQRGFIYQNNNFSEIKAPWETLAATQDSINIFGINDNGDTVGSSGFRSTGFDDFYAGSIDSFPGVARTQYYTFSYGDKSYIVGGFDGDTWLDETWEYDFDTSTWTQLDSLPFPKLIGATSFIIGNYAYIVGGYTDEGTSQEVWRYEYLRNEWEQVSDFPGEFTIGMRFFTQNNTNFVFGGAKDSDYSEVDNQLWTYSFNEDAWEQVVSEELDKIPARANSVVFQLHDVVFLGLGSDGDACLTDFWGLDVYQDIDDLGTTLYRVLEKAESPVTNAGNAGYFRYKSFGYVFGEAERCSGETSNTLYEYEPITDEWRTYDTDLTIDAQNVLISQTQVIISPTIATNTSINSYREDKLGVLAQNGISVAGPQLDETTTHEYIDINNSGDIVGYSNEIRQNESDNDVSARKGIITNASDLTNYTVIPELDSSRDYSQTLLVKINNNGTYIGWGEVEEGISQVDGGYVTWGFYGNKESTELTKIEPLRDGDYYTRASDINDNDVIVGTTYDYKRSGEVTADTEGFILDGDEVTFIGQLLEQFEFSAAYGINNLNQVVGEAQVSHPQQIVNGGFAEAHHGVLYEGGTLLDLNDLTTCDSPYTIVTARGINDAGQIAATAIVETVDEITEETVYRAIAIRLDPISGGTIDTCATEEEDRKDSGSFFWLIPLLAIFALRRKSIGQ